MNTRGAEAARIRRQRKEQELRAIQPATNSAEFMQILAQYVGREALIKAAIKDLSGERKTLKVDGVRLMKTLEAQGITGITGCTIDGRNYNVNVGWTRTVPKLEEPQVLALWMGPPLNMTREQAKLVYDTEHNRPPTQKAKLVVRCEPEQTVVTLGDMHAGVN